MRGLLLAVLATMSLALTGVAGAASPSAKVVLATGQTRWFMPNALQPGALVRCGTPGHEVEAKVPVSPAPGASGSDIAFGKNTPSVQVERRSNGSTEIICGQTAQTFPRPATLPYVIGENGLALIRGANRLSAVEAALGSPSTRAPRGADCRISWPGLGLNATFAGGSCGGSSVLVGATASGSRWSSLNGVHIGDSIARVAWESPGAKPLADHTWLLASGGASGSARLTAVVARDGTVARLVAVVS